jgi:hypothetical protein
VTHSGFFESLKNTFSSSPDSLTIKEYMAWLKEQEGFTFDKQENEKTYLSILYKPLNFEAALSLENNSATELEKHINIKKGFQYLSLEYLDKNYSVTKKTNKEDLIKRLKENVYVIKNDSDTIRNIIIEVFPAYLMNQPDQLLVLIPSSDGDPESDLEAGIKGENFGVPDLRIRILHTDLKSFPEIKI